MAKVERELSREICLYWASVTVWYMAIVDHEEQCIVFRYLSGFDDLAAYTPAVGYIQITSGADTHRFHWTWDMGQDVGTDLRTIIGTCTRFEAFDAVRAAFENPTMNTGFVIGVESANSQFYLGTNWDDARTCFVQQDGNINIAIEFGNTNGTEMMPNSFCDAGIWYRWDIAGNDLYVVLDTAAFGAQEYIIATNTATDQAAVKGILESIYPYGNWNYAWNVSTGNICVEWAGTNATTTFNYTQELYDELNLGDAASAFVVSRYPVNRERWLTESLNNSRIDKVVK